MKPRMELSPELVGVLTTEKTQDLKSNTVNDFLKSNNIDMKAEVAENTESEVNLCLPYYSWIPKERAYEVGDDNLHASGGVEYGTIKEGGMYRLRPTSDMTEWNHRNWMQAGYNMVVTLQYGRPDLADHTYDGDFDYHRYANTNDVALIVNDNPK